MGNDRTGLLGSRIRLRNRSFPGRLPFGASRRGRHSGRGLLGARSIRGAEIAEREGGGTRWRSIRWQRVRVPWAGQTRHLPRGHGVVEPAAGRPVRARARRGRRRTGGGRAAGRVHRRAHRPVAEGQVRGARSRRARADIWWGEINQPIEEANHDGLGRAPARAPQRRPEPLCDRRFAGADPAEQLSVRVVTESAWHALFAQTLFIVPTDEEDRRAPAGGADRDAPTSPPTPRPTAPGRPTFVILHLTNAEILIGGTAVRRRDEEGRLHAHALPDAQAGVLSMHCSANEGRRRRRVAVLRPLGHGQDDPLGRSASAS